MSEMGFKNFHRFCLTAILAMATPAPGAGEFAVPADGPVAFRRDQIPLERAVIADLSKSLVVLAHQLDKSTAVKRRTAAQMLALAIALDPENSAARDLVFRFQKNLSTPTTADHANQTSDRQKQVRQLLAWLESPEAQTQGLALAACLIDVMTVYDADHSPDKEARTASERAAWQGWVPPLTAYAAPTPVVLVKPAPIPVPAFLLEKAQVSTVAWKNLGKFPNSKWAQAPIRLQMNAEIPVNAPFTITVAPELEEKALHGENKSLVEILIRQKIRLPDEGLVSITSPDLHGGAVTPKPQAISAAAAVLVSSALSGCEPDAVILGDVDSSGAFTLPPDLWSQIQALGTGTGKGRRLVLPTAAAEYLPSLLALEKASFFFDYEVLLAANFQELLKLSAKNPDELTANSIASFKSIRDELGTLSVDEYVVKELVRRRLEEISQNLPNHFSSKMLFVQGSGKRPIYSTLKVLASELRLALEPMEWVAQRPVQEFASSEVERLHSSWELCFTQVERLKRYSEGKDALLVERVGDVVADLRTLDRTTRRRNQTLEAFTSYGNFRKNYQNTAREITRIIGDEVADLRIDQ